MGYCRERLGQSCIYGYSSRCLINIQTFFFSWFREPNQTKPNLNAVTVTYKNFGKISKPSSVMVRKNVPRPVLEPRMRSQMINAQGQNAPQFVAAHQLSNQADPNSVARALIHLRSKPRRAPKLVTTQYQPGSDKLVVPKFNFLPLADVQRDVRDLDHRSYVSFPEREIIQDFSADETNLSNRSTNKSVEIRNVSRRYDSEERSKCHDLAMSPQHRRDLERNQSQGPCSWFILKNESNNVIESKSDCLKSKSKTRRFFKILTRRGTEPIDCSMSMERRGESEESSTASRLCQILGSDACSNYKRDPSFTSYAHDDYMEFIAGRKHTFFRSVGSFLVPKFMSQAF